MFCTNCGRQLPKDGTPCVCGSGQTEPVVQETAAAQEWASESAELNTEAVQPAETEWAQAPAAPAVEEAQPAYEEPVASVQEETQPAYEEPVASVQEETQPAYEEPVASVQEETQPVYEEPVAPVQEEAQPQYQQPVYTAPVYQQPVQQNPYIQQPVYQPAQYQQPMYAAPAYAVQQSSPVLDAIRGVASSPIFMIAAIVMSVHLLLSIVQAFVPVDLYGIVYSIVPIVDSIMPGMGSELLYGLEEAMAELYAVQAMAGFLSLPGMIAPALTVAALWMIFVSAKKPNGPKTGGLTILQVLQVLSIIGIGLGVLAAILVVVLICVFVMMVIEEMTYYGLGGGEEVVSVVIAVSVVMIIAILAGVALSLVYAIKVLTSIVNAKKAIRNGVVEKTASKFVMVYNFASAAILLIDIFGTFSLMGWAAGLVNLCAAGANVLFALCILKYNKAVKPLIAQQNAVPQMPQQPNYPQY